MTRRILYIHGIEAIGGAERDLLAVLASLHRAQWEPLVACPAQGPLHHALRLSGVEVHHLVLPPWRKWFSPFVRGQSVRRLRRLIARLRPSLLHVNDIWWVPHALQALRSGAHDRIPIVAHARQEIEPEKAPRYGLDQVEFVIAISRQVEQALVRGGVEPHRVRTIYSGIACSSQPASKPDRPRLCRSLGLSGEVVLLGTVANLFPRKGYDVMLRALPAIIRAEPKAHYLIVGSGEKSYSRTLRKLAHDLGVADHVHFMGFQDAVQSFLAALDLYVHPALMEGFGIAVIEAMAQGKAVVATNVGGLPEVVADGETGLLVLPGDDNELSRAVLELLCDRPRREQMGAKGNARVRERFDVKDTIAGIEGVYRDALAAERAR